MADVEQQILINAPREKVWESWDRFGEIARFNKGLRASSLLPGSPETGVGARRRCDLKNGKSYLMEQIACYKSQELMEIVVFDTDLPVRTVRLMLTFSAPSPDTTKIDAKVNFVMKFGILGRVMKIMAKKEFNGDITRLLRSNKEFNELA